METKTPNLENIQNFKKSGQKEHLLNNFFFISAGLSVSALFLFCFYLPLVKIFQYAFTGGDKIDISEIIAILTRNLNIRAFLFSLSQGISSMVICILIGLPTAYILAKYTFRGKDLLVNILTIPFILPPIVVLMGFLITYGEGGWINTVIRAIIGSKFSGFSLYGSFAGILLAHVFYNVSVIIRMLIPAWQSLDYTQVNVAKTLGRTRWPIFWKIMFPQIRNYLISAGLLVFTYCFNSFAIVLYFGEVKFQTLEVRIFKEIQNNLNFQASAVLAIVQLILNLLIIGLYVHFERKTREQAIEKEQEMDTNPLFSPSLKTGVIIKRLGLGLILLLVSAFSFIPLITVVVQSLTPHNSDISPFWGYKQLFSTVYTPLLGISTLKMLINTLFFALLNTLLTVIISVSIVLLLRQRNHKLNNYQSPIIESIVNSMILFPMASSSITLAIGLFLFYRSTWIFSHALWLLILFAHILVSIPFATRAIISAYNRIDIEMINVAITLGASRWQIFKHIEFPLIKRGLLVACIFAFAISLGEFGATLFLAREQYLTLSLGISKLLSSRTLQLPASMASILIFLTGISFFFIQKLSTLKI